jgi:hypothetical protein
VRDNMEFVKKNVTTLFPKGVFEIGIPFRKVVHSKCEALNIVNEYNGMKRIFFSLYEMDNNPVRESPILSHIWFDFDSNKSQENTIKLHEWCKEKDIEHLCVFSGGGFHFYIFTDKQKINNSKNALMKIHHDIMNELKFTYGDNHECDVDGHIIGDIARIVTIPGTYNVKRKKYAISLKEEELYKSLEEIKKLADKQRCEIFIYGKNKFSLDKYRDIENNYNYKSLQICETAIDFNCDEDINKFPPCIKRILINEDESGNWKGRWYATLFMQEYGLNDEQIDMIAKKYFGAIKRTDNLLTNYHHWKKLKICNTSKDKVFPKCDLLYQQGFCKGKCKWYK